MTRASRRLRSWVLILALPGIWVASAGALPDPEDALERHRSAEVALQSTSAELALLRTRARALAGPALRTNRAQQRELERRKLRLLDRAQTTHGAALAAIERRRAEVRRERRLERERSDAERQRAESRSPAPGVTPAPPPSLDGDDRTLAEAIDGYLTSKASPLVGQGAVFVSASRAVGLDPRFLVAIAGAETSFATYRPSQAIHNPFGMGPGIVYRSWADSIESAARNLGGDLYLGDGRVTIEAIHARWAPLGAGNDPGGLNGHWSRNVAHYLLEQGGDPAAPVFGTPAPVEVAPAPEDTPPVGIGDRVGERPTADADDGVPMDEPERAGADGAVGATSPGRLATRVFANPVVHGPMIDRAQGW